MEDILNAKDKEERGDDGDDDDDNGEEGIGSLARKSGDVESGNGTNDGDDDDRQNLPPIGQENPLYQRCCISCGHGASYVYNMIFNCSPSTENIFAFFWAATVFFIGVVFVIAQYTSNLGFKFVSTYWVLFVFIFIAIIGMSLAIWNRNNPNFVDDSEDDDDENHGDTVSKYLIGNAYIFATGNFLLDFFSIVTVFHCSVGTSEDRDVYVNKFIFHSARIIFTSLQLIFLQIFTCVKIERHYQLFFKLLVVHLIATNFNVWFAFLCQETGILSGKVSEDSGEYNMSCTSTLNDTVYNTVKDMSEVLQPFILEFSLLAASLLYSICPLNLISSRQRSGGRRKYNYGAIDVVKRDDSKVYRSDPGLLLGIFLTLLLIVSSWSLDDKDHFIYNIIFTYSMQIIGQIVIIVSSSAVLYELKTYHVKKSQRRKYRIDDYLLLITGPCGFLPFLATIIFAVSEKVSHEKLRTVVDLTGEDIFHHEEVIKGLLGLLSCINIISVLVQTFFLLEAHSYDRGQFAARRRADSFDRADENALLQEQKKLRSAARIGQWLLLLIMINLAFWITDSFFELRSSLERTYSIARAYWTKKTWNFIVKLLYPIIIFFRFHSVAMIAHVWLHFRVKKKLA